MRIQRRLWRQLRVSKKVGFEMAFKSRIRRARALFDLKGPHTQISRSGHSLTLNISKMAADTVIVTVEGE